MGGTGGDSEPAGRQAGSRQVGGERASWQAAGGRRADSPVGKAGGLGQRYLALLTTCKSESYFKAPIGDI